MNVHIDQREISKRLIPHPLLHRHAKINRARDRADVLQFDIAEFERGAGLDAVTQWITKRPRTIASSARWALARCRPHAPVSSYRKRSVHSDATIIRLLRFLTIIATGSCRQAQPPGPFGR
jgi:hypothetical protein